MMQADPWNDLQAEAEGLEEFENYPPSRFFWWNASDLVSRWLPLYWGGTDEFCNRTLGLRLPGGVLFWTLGWKLRTRMCLFGRCPHA